MLRTKCESSARATHTLSYWAIPPAPNQCLANCYNFSISDLCSPMHWKQWLDKNLTCETFLVFFLLFSICKWCHCFHCVLRFPIFVSFGYINFHLFVLPSATRNKDCIFSILPAECGYSVPIRMEMETVWTASLFPLWTEGICDPLLSPLLSVQSIHTDMSYPQPGAAGMKAGNSFKEEEYRLRNQNRNQSLHLNIVWHINSLCLLVCNLLLWEQIKSFCFHVVCLCCSRAKPSQVSSRGSLWSLLWLPQQIGTDWVTKVTEMNFFLSSGSQS